MKFTPIDPAQLSRAKELIPGIYRFRVASAVETISQAGNPMIKLILDVYGHDGNPVTYYDHLPSLESMMWKLHHFCQSLAIEKNYENGDLPAVSLIGKEGQLEIHVRTKRQQSNADMGTRGEVMISKSEIKDYIPRKIEEEFNDDVPF